MIINGRTYCNYCNLEINRYHRHVKIRRDPADSEHPDDEFVHLHNRDGYSNDCWERVRKAAEVLKASKRPTAQDMSDFERFCAQQDAKKAAGGVQ